MVPIGPNWMKIGINTNHIYVFFSVQKENTVSGQEVCYLKKITF